MHSPSFRVFITGGAGFIGSHMVDECLARGHTVLVYDNFSAGRKEHLPQEHGQLTIVAEDILNGDALRRALTSFLPTHIVHLAALHYIPYCNNHPLETIDVNIKGTEQVLSAASLLSPSLSRVIVASSAAVYAPSLIPHEEQETPGPTDVYGLSKYANEIQAKHFHNKTEVPVVVARIFNAYGPRETNPHLIPEIFTQMQQGKEQIELGNVTTKRSYIYVTDLAKALVLLLESKNVQPYDTFNIGSQYEYNALEILEILSRVSKNTIRHVSATKRQRKSDCPHLQPALSKIQTLGWAEQCDMEQGLSCILNQ